MIEWLERHDPGRVFLDDGARQMTYGGLLAAIASSPVEPVEVIHPCNDLESVVSIFAAMVKGTALLISPGRSTPAQVDPGDAAVVVFTSGSGGPPKGVRHTLDNWAAAADASMRHLGHGPDDTWLLAVPLHHVAGLGILLRSAYAGGKVRMLKGFDAPQFAGVLHTVTMASVVPTMLARILATGPGHYTGLRAVLVGGAPIPEGLLEKAAAVGLPVLPTYGMTETCGQVATLLPGTPLQRKAHPLPGVELRIGAEGRIEIRGPMVSPGYLGEPDREPESWFVTHDVGTVDASGALTVVGRVDDLIITGGEKVTPREVEAIVRAQEGVEDALVVGVPSDEWGTEVGCIYTGTVARAELSTRLAGLMPGFMTPKRLVNVGTIPLLVTGKPDRAKAVEALVGST